MERRHAPSVGRRRGGPGSSLSSFSWLPAAPRSNDCRPCRPPIRPGRCRWACRMRASFPSRSTPNSLPNGSCRWSGRGKRWACAWSPVAAVHLLAISGGGDNGAFGSGLLVGWTEAGDRPQFQVVTGVSTGALIAPVRIPRPGLRSAAPRGLHDRLGRRHFQRRGFFAASSVMRWPIRRRFGI